MGMTPAFSLAANNHDITGVVTERISSLTLTTEMEHQSDELSLTPLEYGP